MRKKMRRTAKYLIICLLFSSLFSCLPACGAGGASGGSGGGSSDGGGGFEVPEFRDSVFSEDAAEGNSEVLVDTSQSNKGYFGLYCTSDKKIKVQVFKDDEVYTYDVVTDKVQIYPFQLGDGSYTIKVMKNITDNKYSELYVTYVYVELDDEFDPFLRPNQYADYTIDSACVKKADELAASAADANEFITNVYNYVCKNVKYDKNKAATVQSGYIPEPDETYKTGKGICIDYAALAAAMLRSHGIPTKVIFGYVGENADLYHAWNMYYTEESGWVAVEFEVHEGEWNRLDLTFSANGSDSNYIGDGSNYLDVYQF
ncbi:MAG: transglutaminase domain-containing protein [Clostridiales bacterium]|nr:transglutaminase domain-containing protein [Clostridiales bacterium]